MSPSHRSRCPSLEQKKNKKPLSCAMTVTARGDESLRAHSQPLLHYQLQIVNVLHTVGFPLAYSIMPRRHHSNGGPCRTLGFPAPLAPLLANAVALLLLVAVIALPFGGPLLSSSPPGRWRLPHDGPRRRHGVTTFRFPLAFYSSMASMRWLMQLPVAVLSRVTH